MSLTKARACNKVIDTAFHPFDPTLLVGLPSMVIHLGATGGSPGLSSTPSQGHASQIILLCQGKITQGTKQGLWPLPLPRVWMRLVALQLQ